jgi:dephospho-CoA kinase
MSPIVKIGLTGGIGSGKSQAAKLFLKSGIPVVDMDKISRELVENDANLRKEIIQTMGNEILTGGEIDRLKLRTLIFSNPQKKTQLERLIHPRVRNQFDALALEEEGKGKRLIVCEAALLIEGGYKNTLDRLVVVMAPEALRKERLLNRDRIQPELAVQMIKNQTSDTERLACATYVIHNDSTLENLEDQVNNLINIWKKESLIQ